MKHCCICIYIFYTDSQTFAFIKHTSNEQQNHTSISRAKKDIPDTDKDLEELRKNERKMGREYAQIFAAAVGNATKPQMISGYERQLRIKSIREVWCQSQSPSVKVKGSDWGTFENFTDTRNQLSDSI